MNEIANHLDPETSKNVTSWLNGVYDQKTKDHIRKLLRDNLQEVVDSFYTNLSFGTAGVRGIMGVGSNRMNNYTVRAITQGLANYINEQSLPKQGHSAFICYDSRHNSRSFAEETAKVLAANGFKVFLCNDLNPTPLVSFGCRFKHCSIGIMITASHNLPKYNGYKVYWSDGGPLRSPHDKGIMLETAKITDPSMVKTIATLEYPVIEKVGIEIEEEYIKQGSKLQLYPEQNKTSGIQLGIVYTNLHGAGFVLTPSMLIEWGFCRIYQVEEQRMPDGDFPTIRVPNPEDKAALAMGIEQLNTLNADLLIANDGDADRVGIAVKHHNQVVILSGNQLACICLAHICEALTQQNSMPPKAAFIKTQSTTELFQEICTAYGKPCFNVLTGFKHIAEMIEMWHKDPSGYQFIFGAEESYGYLYGDITLDKDGVLASALICEATLHAKLQGKTLIDVLYDLYRKYGVFNEAILTLNFEETKTGKEQMRASMQSIRNSLPSQINGIDILVIEDYQASLKTNLKTKTTQPLHLAKSDVLIFWLMDGSKLMIRPSGTEPKIKLHCGVVDKMTKDIDVAVKGCEAKANQFLEVLQELLG